MGEPRPAARIEAQLGHYGKHWFIRCEPGVPALGGRGVEDRGVLTADRLVPGSRLVGWHEYKVTEREFARLCKLYAVSSESLL